MLGWLKRRRATSSLGRLLTSEQPAGRQISGPYQPLHRYLDTRFADTVVLTFAEIEDVLGCRLPVPARVDSAWWGSASGVGISPHHSEAWTCAKRTAIPNLQAGVVSFPRAF
jgi:hypothetical protein